MKGNPKGSPNIFNATKDQGFLPTMFKLSFQRLQSFRVNSKSGALNSAMSRTGKTLQVAIIPAPSAHILE